jgi:hypothetical protein
MMGGMQPMMGMVPQQQQGMMLGGSAQKAGLSFDEL